MQTRGLHSVLVQKSSILGGLLFLSLFGLYSHGVQAQLQARPLSPSVVLVLKLVSQDRVQPTTGIVMSDDGLVMVPAEFVSKEAEIIVLDGGTDIIKNGRPARMVDQPGSNGWALLRVNGLKRPGIKLSGNPLSEASSLHLTAFPPAEYIANGLPPLWADVKVQSAGSDGAWSISAETPQPYVTGPILDECGLLAGISLSSGVQSIKPDQLPVTIFADSLKETLNALQLAMPLESCAITKEKANTLQTVATTQKAQSKPPPAQATDPKLVKPEVYSPVIQRKRLNPFQGATPRPSTIEQRSLWSHLPLWLPLLGLIMLSVVAWKAWFFFRLRRQSATTGGGGQPDNSGLQSVTFESQESTARIRSAPGDDEIMPDLDTLPSACNGVVAVEVIVDSSTRFHRFHAIDTQQIDLVIGRVDSDINIQLAGVGNQHVRLVKRGEIMTLSDLGSGCRTLINGLPCLPGEIMYLEADADIYLGDALLHISIVSKDLGAT